MTRETRIVWTVFGIGLLMMAAGCGGSGSAPPLNATHVRMLNDYVDVAKVTGKVGSKLVLSNQPFATFSTYQSFPESVASSISFFDAGTSGLLATTNQGLTAGVLYTAYGIGSAGNGRHVVVLQDSGSAVPGQGSIRMANFDEEHTDLDVYVTSTSTTSLSGLTPQATGVDYLSDPTTYFTFSPGTYTVWFTAPSQPATVIAKNDITFNAGQVETLGAIKTSGGVIIQEIPDGPSV